MPALDLSAFRKPASLVLAKNAKLEVRTPNGGGKDEEDVFLHPTQRWEEMMVVRRKGGRFCLIHPSVATRIPTKRLRDCTLYAAASSVGGNFVMPVVDVEGDRMHMAEAAQKAMGHWAWIAWDTGERKYVASEPRGEHADPVWPFEDFAEMVEAAFGDHIIDREDHPLLKEITGE